MPTSRTSSCCQWQLENYNGAGRVSRRRHANERIDMSDTNNQMVSTPVQAARPADPAMRARFEAMMATRVSSLTRDPVDDGYKAPDTHRAWLAWQMATEEAARASAAAAEQVHFYRRGDEKVWYKTSAEHVESVSRLTGERYECQSFYTAPPATPLIHDFVETMGEGMGEGDAIARSKFILRLVDAYVEKPGAGTRTALRTALMHQFDRDITPQGLLDIARTTGLRARLHGVPPSLARELLAQFVAAVPAAACGARQVVSQADDTDVPAVDAPAP